MSIYDTARQLKIPGVVVQAHIDTTQISPRIKKMTQDMLRKGKLKGGWSSKSLQLARQLMRGHHLPVLNGWDTMFRCQQLSPNDLAQFDEWFDADAALEKMKMTAAQTDSRWYVDRINTNIVENKRAIRKLNPKHLVQFYLRIDSPDMREQINDKLLSLRLPEDIAALCSLADRLDDPTPIPMELEIF
ncbi:MAG: hypothetical protein ACR2IJ_00245 [Fluviibacter sp.]